MILAVDIGNTSIKVGRFEDNRLIDALRVNSLDEAFDFAVTIQADAVGIASVRSETKSEIERIAPTIQTLLIDHTTPLPFEVDYRSPETLGIDRLCLAAAAHHRFLDDNVLIIDLGTCITYDILERNIYRGGGISPGVGMRLKAMHHFTSKLPEAEFPDHLPEIGNDTTTSLQFGAVQGTLAELRGIFAHFARSYPNLKVILTGGDAPLFEQHIENAIFAAPNLVLEGIHEILRINTQGG